MFTKPCKKKKKKKKINVYIQLKSKRPAVFVVQSVSVQLLTGRLVVHAHPGMLLPFLEAKSLCPSVGHGS